MSRADRLLRLIQLLRRYRQPVSAARLAEELNVSLRSIYRDIQTLRGEGASIDGEPGVGYLLKPGFLLPPLMFTDEEIEALVLGLRLTVVHADDMLGRAAAEVVAKLRAVLPKDLRAVVDETALLAGPALARPPETVELGELRRAIREQKKARIVYTNDRGTQSERVIWPLGLAFFQRVRLLVAWCEMRGD
ncbi:MAG TPA: YafY family protein, partial [Polyangiaceae bacterium]|nr:YafY family protein [Polyangiaceae bacterium]